MSIAVEDWDDLSAAPRPRDQRAAPRAATAEADERGDVAPSPAAQKADGKGLQDDVSVAVEDWDGLSAVRRRRAQAATANGERGDVASAPAVQKAVAHDLDDDELDYGDTEDLRPVLSIAGGNVAIWALAHLTGIVELVGVSFFASVGLLLASYVLREWHRDRAALVCLAGALPLPVTIFSLLT
jgi:hypothetical protein